jgi:hypothetical protein
LKMQTMQEQRRFRRGERGVTMVLVALGMFAILAMAVLAIDIVSLYVAKSDAQRAADAAALAGARMFVLSGSTSGATVTPSDVCAGGTGGSAANALATAAAAANTVAGTSATISNFTCANDALNPRISVTVSNTSLPLFFARIFGTRTASVTATATAEAFNNSGDAPITSVGSVKPWAIANCGAGGTSSNPCTTKYFIDEGTYALNSPATYIGSAPTFTAGKATGPTPNFAYYPIDFSSSTPAIRATLCPEITGACSALALGTAPYYEDNIACSTNSHSNQRLSCGSMITLTQPLIASTPTTTQDATQCLIHQTGTSGQDTINPGTPVTITGGTGNPNPALQGVVNISRSDSVVTVPVFKWAGDPCAGAGSSGPCNQVAVIGFLQLGINSVSSTGDLGAVVVNAVGCNPIGIGGTTMAGGGLGPIPVRLVQ